jgi:hypothetical protein
MRITFQKALGSAFKVPGSVLPETEDPAGELAQKRADTLASLAKLSDTLFDLRATSALTLPGTAERKRKRSDADVDEEAYWTSAAVESLALDDA